MPPVSSVNLGRFEYLLQSNSRAQIARMTGIPNSALTSLSLQKQDLTRDQSNSLWNAFRRQSYADLREAGMSASQASRFSSSSVEGVISSGARFVGLVNNLSEGLFEIRKNQAEKRGQPFNESSERLKAEDDVKQGLRQSRKTIEDWEKYIPSSVEEEEPEEEE